MQPDPSDENVPIGHGSQVSERKQDEPALQVTEHVPEQSVASSCSENKVAESLRYLPAAQVTQAGMESVLNEPAGQTAPQELNEKRDPVTKLEAFRALPFVAVEKV